MKRFICMVLCLVTLLSFTACGQKEDPEKLADWKPEGEYPTINQKFTRESLNALPIKRTDMTEDEMRELIVSFMYFSKNQALYTPSESYKYEITPIYPDEFKKDTVYSGMPFMNTGCGNIYRLLDIMDEASGVLNMTDLMANIDLFSNTCPSACYWAWGRVCSSISYFRIAQMTQANGFLPVGGYTYDATLTEFSETNSTQKICAQNTLATMSNAYAQLKKGDGLVTAGSDVHCMMVTGDVNIVYFSGTDQIDPSASTVTYIDQNYVWGEAQNDQGDTYLRKNNVDSTHTFMTLFNKGYIPFTTAELNGTKPVEETNVEISLSGDAVTVEDIFSSTVTCNFGISDIYVTLRNKNGNDVYRHTVRATLAGVKELKVSEFGANVFTQGNLETLSGDYTVEISVQLSTGERPVVYTGTIQL